MFSSSRVAALSLATLVALLTTAALWITGTISSSALVSTIFLSFSITFILVWLTLEFLVFREIREFYKVLGKLRKKDFSFTDEEIEPANPLKKVNREVYGYAMERQKEIDDLRNLEVFRREFLADVSHELKTPVFAAQGYVHTLLDGAVDDKKVRGKFLKRAAKSLDNLDDLIHDLLTLSQIETGQSKMRFEDFDVLETAQEVLEEFEDEAIKKDIYFSFNKLYEEPIFVYADAKWVYRVLLNLVSNAIKYTDEGKVSIGFKVSEKQVSVLVKDSGLGIPKDLINRVFERFFRVDKSRSKERGGTGLGLAIVKHILEAHNSKVVVESNEGKGSTFSFVLPQGRPSDEVLGDLAELEPKA